MGNKHLRFREWSSRRQASQFIALMWFLWRVLWIDPSIFSRQIIIDFSLDQIPSSVANQCSWIIPGQLLAGRNLWFVLAASISTLKARFIWSSEHIFLRYSLSFYVCWVCLRWSMSMLIQKMMEKLDCQLALWYIRLLYIILVRI